MTLARGWIVGPSRRDIGVGWVGKAVTFLKLGSMRSMALSMSGTQILANEGAMAVGKSATVYFLWCIYHLLVSMRSTSPRTIAKKASRQRMHLLDTPVLATQKKKPRPWRESVRFN